MMMQPLSIGFYLSHSCSNLSPDMGKDPLPWRRAALVTVPVREPQRKESASARPAVFPAISVHLQDKHGRHGARRVVQAGARPGPDPVSLTCTDAQGGQHWTCRGLGLCVSEQTLQPMKG